MAFWDQHSMYCDALSLLSMSHTVRTDSKQDGEELKKEANNMLESLNVRELVRQRRQRQ